MQGWMTVDGLTCDTFPGGCLFSSRCPSHWNISAVWIIPPLSCWQCQGMRSTKPRWWRRKWLNRPGRRVKRQRRWHGMHVTEPRRWRSMRATRRKRLHGRRVIAQRRWHVTHARNARRWPGRHATAPKKWRAMRVRSAKRWLGMPGLWFTITTCRSGSMTMSFWRRDIDRSSTRSLPVSGRSSEFTQKQATSGLTC